DLLNQGQRTATPRHQNLVATLDWSHDLLSDDLRSVLRRLAVLSGPFTIAAAIPIAALGAQTCEVTAHRAELVAKSLVTASTGVTGMKYRLLDTTRAYALRKLSESGELHAVRRRHAEYFHDLCQARIADWQARPDAELHNDLRRNIDNIRAAL